MSERYDAVIIGAGPAGIAAAITLARAGLSAIVFERGVSPGSKNMFGGILYTNVLNGIVPGFRAEAPLERRITKRTYAILSKDSEASFGVDLKACETGAHDNGFTVLRARFDAWFAKKAEDAGAIIVNEAVVDDFITERGRIKGVKVRMEGGDVLADVVILADGVNSLLAEKAGLRRRPDAAFTALGVKEIISLPSGVIEDRFSLDEGQGAAFECFGAALGGVPGQGFIYTNKDSLSVGIGCPISILKEKGMTPNELIDGFKEHRSIKRLLRGGSIEEYSAHMIPEGGFNAIPELTTDGLMLAGDAAGFVNPSLYKEGTNMAMASGVFAGETAIEAKARGAFSKAALDGYRGRLDRSFVIKDLERFKDVPGLLHSSPELFSAYPELVMEALKTHFTVSDKTKAEIHREIRRLVKEKVSLWRLLKDIYRMRRLFS